MGAFLLFGLFLDDAVQDRVLDSLIAIAAFTGIECCATILAFAILSSHWSPPYLVSRQMSARFSSRAKQ